MKNDKIFDALKNYDDSQTEKLEKYLELSENETDRIFRKSRAKYKSSNSKVSENSSYEDSVSGVVVYKKSKWRKFTAAASVVAATGLAVSGGVLFLNTMKSVDIPGNQPYYVESETETMTETTPFEDDTYEEIPIENTYNELPVHEEIFYQDKPEEAAFEMLDKHQITRDFSDRTIDIDRDYYINLIETSSPESLNSDINKTYIYHMMLNSIDYFDTAQGVVSYYTAISGNRETYSFATDMLGQYACEMNADLNDPNSNEHEIYYDNGKFYTINHLDKTYTIEERRMDGFEYTTFEDDYRVIKYEDGTRFITSGRTDFTMLSTSSFVLFPQDIAASRLLEFEYWNIDSLGNWNGRKTALISGEKDDYREGGLPYKFNIEVDLETGIMLSYSESDLNDYERESYSIEELFLNRAIIQAHPNIQQYKNDGFTENFFRIYRTDSEFDNSHLNSYADICREFCSDYAEAYNKRDGSSLVKYTENEDLQKYLKHSAENQVVECISSNGEYEINSITTKDGYTTFVGFYGDSEGMYGMVIFIFNEDTKSLSDVYWYTKGSYDRIYRSQTDEMGYDKDFWNDRIKVEGLFKNVGIPF